MLRTTGLSTIAQPEEARCMDQSPITALNPDDPGDDVQRRFRFQATAAAIWSLALLDDDTELQAVYCELHEDILLHKRGGRFRGIQIKSKLDDLVPHKATDEEIVGSIKRFVGLEMKFGAQFDGYSIASNVSFWDEGASATSLPHILKEVLRESC